MKKQFILNASLRGFSIGKTLFLECDEEGTPIDLYWYRRFKDAALDNCISAVKGDVSKAAKSTSKDS